MANPSAQRKSGFHGAARLQALVVIALVLTVRPPLAQQWPQPLSVPVHGNWCGPGYGGGAAPTDLLDAACMRHDICVARQGRGDCGCDIGFMNDLRMTAWPNAGLRAKARAIYDAMAVVPCESPAGQAAKIEMAGRDWVNDVTSGRAAPWDFLSRWCFLGRDAANGVRWRRY